MTTLATTDVIPRLKRVLPRFAAQLQPGSTLGDLGLDSMDTVELLCAIHEEFNVRLLEGEFGPGMRLEELAETISHKANHEVR
ncbi:MAG: hypothetical protein JWO82_3469 [Akkermansiaceae bacterium]|nr:hypothetical protein [Akkermansiaceae bacterium]